MAERDLFKVYITCMHPAVHQRKPSQTYFNHSHEDTGFCEYSFDVMNDVKRFYHTSYSKKQKTMSFQPKSIYARILTVIRKF